MKGKGMEESAVGKARLGLACASALSCERMPSPPFPSIETSLPEAPQGRIERASPGAVVHEDALWTIVILVSSPFSGGVRFRDWFALGA